MKNSNLEKSIHNLLKELDEPDREGLKDTPKRVAKHLIENCTYKDKSLPVPTLFNSEGYDEIIVLKDISYYSTCEHHAMAFFGTVNFGYLPSKRIIGVSKIVRIVEFFSSRLQIQERLTMQIADALEKSLHPKGLGILVEGIHLCMRARGVKQPNSVMITSAMRGIFRKSDSVRNEFLRLIGK